MGDIDDLSFKKLSYRDFGSVEQVAKVSSCQSADQASDNDFDLPDEPNNELALCKAVLKSKSIVMIGLLQVIGRFEAENQHKVSLNSTIVGSIS